MSDFSVNTINDLRRLACCAREAYRNEKARCGTGDDGEAETEWLLERICEALEEIDKPDSLCTEQGHYEDTGPHGVDRGEGRPSVVTNAVVTNAREQLAEVLEDEFQRFGHRLVEELVGALLQPLAAEIRQLAEHSTVIRDAAASLLAAVEQEAGRRSLESEQTESLRLSIEGLLNDQSAEEQAEAVQRLQAELDAARQEIEDLQQQNADLASQLAKAEIAASGHHPHINFDAESLPWEERKKRILQQLQADDAALEGEHDEAALQEQEATRLEVERVLAVTDREIQRRDEEIAELKRLLEQQAQARDEIAVGAAGVAQMLESHPLIEAERKKLREIQQQWEEKLRQAEIDLSMERAKLARERRELETEKEQLRTKLEALEQTTELPSGRRRRWLDVLGLRDEME